MSTFTLNPAQVPAKKGDTELAKLFYAIALYTPSANLSRDDDAVTWVNISDCLQRNADGSLPTWDDAIAQMAKSLPQYTRKYSEDFLLQQLQQLRATIVGTFTSYDVYRIVSAMVTRPSFIAYYRQAWAARHGFEASALMPEMMEKISNDFCQWFYANEAKQYQFNAALRHYVEAAFEKYLKSTDGATKSGGVRPMNLGQFVGEEVDLG